MVRFHLRAVWNVVCALLLLGSAVAVYAQAPVNLALTATSSSSSDWNADFAASKANDGDMTTRWNSADGDTNGSWLAMSWSAPQTFNKVVIKQAFDRIRVFRLQVMDAATKDWKDVYTSPENINPTGNPNPTFTIILKPAVSSTGVRAVFDEVTVVPSIFEIEVYNAPQGTITGVVKDANGAPIEGAGVTAGTSTAVTDASGKYTLSVDAGQYDVTATKPAAFRARTARGVVVAADATVTQDFSLVALPPNLAKDATAVSSSDWSTDYDASKANDGVLTTRWNSAGGDVEGSWLELDWSSPQTFNKIAILEFGGRIQDYSLQRFDSAKNDFVDFYHGTAAGAGVDITHNVFLAQPVTSKALRLMINKATNVPSIYELMVSNAPTGTVQGTVTDFATGKGIGGASIVADPAGVVGTADANGAFTVVLEPDEYLMNASAPGYLAGIPQTADVTVGGTVSVNISLPATGENLATKGTLSSSTDDGTNTVANLVDGDPTTQWVSDPAETKNQWIGVTWAAPTTFRMVSLHGLVGTIQKSQIETMDASGNWQAVPNTVFNPQFSGPDKTFLFDQPITAKGVRYFIFYTDHDLNQPKVGEFGVYNPPVLTPVTPAPVKGDANGDGKVLVNDAVLALQFAVGLKTPTAGQLKACDLNGDGKIGINEATLILQAAVGLRTL